MTLNYACVFGRVKLVLYDEREGSPDHRLREIFLGPDNHSLVVIPPGVWTGFKGMSAPLSMVANCCTASARSVADHADGSIPQPHPLRLGGARALTAVATGRARFRDVIGRTAHPAPAPRRHGRAGPSP
jgi:hypothetical protein